MTFITDTLVDQIYEAALLPDLWPAILERLAAHSNASKGGVLFTVNPYYSGWKASAAMFPMFSEYVASEWVTRNRRPAYALAKNHAGFFGDDELFTRQEMDEDPFYHWMRERGAGWCFGTAI